MTPEISTVLSGLPLSSDLNFTIVARTLPSGRRSPFASTLLPPARSPQVPLTKIVDAFTARARLPNLNVTSGHVPPTSETTPATVMRSSPVCWTMMLLAVIVSPLLRALHVDARADDHIFEVERTKTVRDGDAVRNRNCGRANQQRAGGIVRARRPCLRAAPGCRSPALRFPARSSSRLQRPSAKSLLSARRLPAPASPTRRMFRSPTGPVPGARPSN